MEIKECLQLFCRAQGVLWCCLTECALIIRIDHTETLAVLKKRALYNFPHAVFVLLWLYKRLLSWNNEVPVSFCVKYFPKFWSGYFVFTISNTVSSPCIPNFKFKSLTKSLMIRFQGEGENKTSHFSSINLTQIYRMLLAIFPFTNMELVLNTHTALCFPKKLTLLQCVCVLTILDKTVKQSCKSFFLFYNRLIYSSN